MNAETNYGRFGSGHSVQRIEDPTLVTGKGVFVDDVSVPGQLYLCFLRSHYPHARIVSIDTSAAMAMPGVVSVVTGAELTAAGVKPFPNAAGFKRPGGEAHASPPRLCLADGTARFVGEAVVAIVAKSRDEAYAARDAVMVDYEELPMVVATDAAIEAGAALVWPQATGNVCNETLYGNVAACDAAFAAAAHVVTLDLVNQRLVANPMEPRAVLAVPDAQTGRLTMRMSTQMPSGARASLCSVLPDIALENVRVVVGDVGGGFGMKTSLYPEDAVVAWCALKLGQPVKWTADRSDEFLATTHGRDLLSKASLALDAQGKVLGLRVSSHANVGAYATPAGVAIQLLIGPWVTTSIYDIPVIDFRLRAVLTNTAPTGAYRGAGRPEAIYIIERLMDAAARRLGIDQADLRRRNMIRPDQMPYKNLMGQTYDTGAFEKMTTQALELADWTGFDARLEQSRARGKLRGRGIASFLEWTSGNAFEERVTVKVAGDGYIEIFTATQAMGQGIATCFAQLAVDTFGVSIDKIRIIQGDTDRGVGFGSAGSRSLFTAGSAVEVAAKKTVDLGRQLAGDALEVAPSDIEYREGSFNIVGTDRGIGLFALAARQPEQQVFIDSTTKVDGPSWPNGCHICEVEVDPETGEVEVSAYASVNDVGRVVNPMIVVGQLDGGAIQGIGQALCEEVVYDRHSGQLITGSLSDYALPRVEMVRSFKTRLDQSVPCKTNPLGVKGVGELGTIGATPAVVNAVVDAVWRHGSPEAALAMQMPLTAEKVWQALVAKR